ncbi:AI-2E family transporter [Halotalea alkalilenta]|uniref:AI-2E family transporter n=1 Tax=Halotalea alkalilenta TaxID=376489 RepID=UPI0005BA9399|nr:AI-2E family transporter [Halotalea alkalilenta]
MRLRWWGLLTAVGFFWMVTLLSPILMPFFIGFILAYLGNPIVGMLERSGLSRLFAVILFFLLIGTLTLLGMLILLPLLWQQLLQFFYLIPEMLIWLQGSVVPYLEHYLDLDLSTGFEQIRLLLLEHWRETGSFAASLLAQMSRSGLVLALWLINITLVPVVAFYLLLDWERMIAAVRGLLPRRIEPTVSRLAGDCDEVLGAFLRGQLIVMVSLGTVYASGLSLLGVSFGALIGMAAGVISIVPYLGALSGFTTAILVAFFQFDSLWALVGVCGVFLLGQMLETFVFQPLLLGDKIGLHPVAVIFAVLAGGQLFGFFGILLALPIAAMVMVLLRFALERYRSSALFERGSVRIEIDGGSPRERP